jgi:hypothetical protein
MSCLLICKDINSAHLKGKNMLMNVFNTNIYFICFISILVLDAEWFLTGQNLLLGKQTKLHVCSITYTRLMFHLFSTQNVNFQWLTYVKGIFDSRFIIF